jgi:tRNA (cmo5U34)-methyltransferase
MVIFASPASDSPSVSTIKPPDSPPTEPSQTAHDDLFQRPPETDFRFDQQTAAVFDDMIQRSVPLYGEMQRMTGEIAADFVQPGTSLFDLGCATGNTLLQLDGIIDPGICFVGVDSSEDMLSKARSKLTGLASERRVELVAADLHRSQVVENASVAVMNLTLQFIRPLYREKVIRNIVSGLADQGCLILIEKLIFDDSLFNRLFIRYYYEMKKRQGYSESEIAHKREALENVLVPYRPEENRELLKAAGFRNVEEFFRWYNFCGLLAVK